MKYGWSGGSGLSGFFTPEDFLLTHPPLKEDRTSDVVVIGGGLSGLLCAYELLKGGRSVCLCTSHTVGNGASRYGAGILCGDSGADLTRLRQTKGRDTAVSWYRLSSAGVEQVEHIVAEIGSKCDFRRRDVFYYTADGNPDSLREEYRWRRHVGTPCRWLDRDACTEAFSFPCSGGILSENCGAELNLVRFCRDLEQWILLHGGEIFEGTRVERIEGGTDGYLCRSGSHAISSDFVVDARGGEALKRSPHRGQRVTVFSIVTEPVASFAGWQDRCILKSRDSCTYLRTTPDHRIVFSGAVSSVLSSDGSVGGLDLSAACRGKYRTLEEELREMFFGIPRIRREFGFCQTVILPRGGLPSFGRDPRWKGLFYLYPFGEAGIASAAVGASWIARMVADPSVKSPVYLEESSSG
ncbi:MAG: FAD-binding oxidoreductase [Clostridia bacterium]|nr:FAD-binding oxidoreductase [Clostridia bacterium]